jgi:hypothetical protein
MTTLLEALVEVLEAERLDLLRIRRSCGLAELLVVTQRLARRLADLLVELGRLPERHGERTTVVD